MAPALQNAGMGALSFSDATGTPIVAIFTPTEGDFSLSGLEEGGYQTELVANRGAWYERVKTTEKEYSGSITLHMDGDFTDATTKQVLDAVLKTGAFSAGVTDEAGGVTWTGEMAWTITRNSVVNTATLPQCRLSADLSESFPVNSITINFTCPGSNCTFTTA